MNLDLSQDYLSWDNVETVRVEVARRPVVLPSAPAQPSPNLTFGCPGKRRAIQSKELAASQGVYRSDDVVWLIPRRPTPQGFSLKPADVIQDGEGNRYTVLECQLNSFKSWWRATTRDLVLADSLFERVDIQRADMSLDGAGVKVKAFPPDGWTAAKGAPPAGKLLYANLPAAVQLMTQEVVDQRGIRAFQGNYAIIVGRQIDVTFEDRVSWYDPAGVQHYFDIKGLHNPSRIDENPVIDAELRP